MPDQPPQPPASSSSAKLWLAEVTLLAVAIIWGVNIPLMKTALGLSIDGRSMDPYAFNGLRLIVSSLILLLFAWREYRSGIRPAAGLSWTRMLIYAALVSGAYQLLFLLAVSRTSSADLSLIMATVPMWTALSARLFLRETLPTLAWAGLVIAFAGTMIVTLQKPPRLPAPDRSTASASDSAHLRANVSTAGAAADRTAADRTAAAGTLTSPADQRFLGNLLSLAAALAWAGGTVFSRPLLKSISPTQLSAFSATLWLPFHLLIASSVIPAALPLMKSGWMQFYLLYSGLLSTGLALAMWSYGVKIAGAAQAAIFQNLTPVFAIAAAWLWRGETVSAGQIIGGTMIIGGVIIMRRSRGTA